MIGLRFRARERQSGPPSIERVLYHEARQEGAVQIPALHPPGSPRLQTSIELEVKPDHVHALVEVHPQYGIHRLVKTMKGRSSRALRAEFP